MKNIYTGGDYYRLSIVEEKINSSSYSQTIKKNLIRFIRQINLVGITNVSKNMSYNTCKKYIEILTKLDINPITIDEHSSFDCIPNILNRVIEIAETKFTENQNEK